MRFVCDCGVPHFRCKSHSFCTSAVTVSPRNHGRSLVCGLQKATHFCLCCAHVEFVVPVKSRAEGQESRARGSLSGSRLLALDFFLAEVVAQFPQLFLAACEERVASNAERGNQARRQGEWETSRGVHRAWTAARCCTTCLNSCLKSKCSSAIESERLGTAELGPRATSTSRLTETLNCVGPTRQLDWAFRRVEHHLPSPV
jgi:hypothetical protein